MCQSDRKPKKPVKQKARLKKSIVQPEPEPKPSTKLTPLFTFINPKGEYIASPTLFHLCRKYGLEQQQMARLHEGKALAYRGWTKG